MPSAISHAPARLSAKSNYINIQADPVMASLTTEFPPKSLINIGQQVISGQVLAYTSIVLLASGFQCRSQCDVNSKI